MSTTNELQPASPAPVPEELVAYLDGELSPDDCRQVEERLAADADYRQQLRDLDQAWEALDSLPSTAVDDDFARTTIEMVALSAQHERSQRASDVAATNRRQRLAWALGGGAVVTASFLVGRWLLPSADARLLVDLPVIRQVDLLTQIKDADFLRRLTKEGLPDQLATDAAAVEQEVAQIGAASDPSFTARREWIASLTPDRKADLAAQQDRFEELPDGERRQLQDLEHEIAAADDVVKLQRTMSAYGQWLTRQSSSVQSRLRNLAIDDERIRDIRDIMQREDRLATQKLSPEDAKKLHAVILAIYDERREEFREAMRRFSNNDRPRGLEGNRDAMALVAVTWALRNQDPDDRTQRRIVEQLSPAAQDQLKRFARSDDERRARYQLWQWMREAMRPKREADNIERFFASELLTNEQRVRLLSLPRDEMDAELERMFLGAQLGGQRGAEWFGDFDRPGPPPGDGPFRGPPGGQFGPPPPDGPDGRGGQGFNRDRRGPGPDGRRNGRPRLE
jgi:anti-sigma factor RsiW